VTGEGVEALKYGMAEKVDEARAQQATKETETAISD
jgi:hypothetical protein